jgi:nucleoside-diphosphate-sugar epimerase
MLSRRCCMNIFIAGATGAVGRALIPQLIEHGHTVTGTTRSPDKADALRALGATPVVVDGLDRDGLINAVKAVGPDVVVHQMTALSNMGDLRHFEQVFAMTNRLRTEGTDNILAAAREVGALAIVQSFAGWPYEPTGSWVKDEDAPLMMHPPKQLRTSIEAIRHIEEVVPAAGGMVLRYGGFYGPGTGLAPGGEQWEMIRARKFPIVGDGGGMWSLCHIEDAASATLAAIEHPAPGTILNICDDEPTPARELLPALAKAVGAKPPRHFPRWIARMMGAHLVLMTCTARGASNARAKEVLGWRPSVPTWREGFAQLSTVS